MKQKNSLSFIARGNSEKKSSHMLIGAFNSLDFEIRFAKRHFFSTLNRNENIECQPFNVE
jgi:hypothetical protein